MGRIASRNEILHRWRKKPDIVDGPRAEGLAHANSESSLGHRVEQIQPLQGHAPRSGFSVTPAVWIRYQLPHRLPLVHDRARGLAGYDRRGSASNRRASLPARLRFLAQNIR